MPETLHRVWGWGLAESHGDPEKPAALQQREPIAGMTGKHADAFGGSQTQDPTGSPMHKNKTRRQSELSCWNTLPSCQGAITLIHRPPAEHLTLHTSKSSKTCSTAKNPHANPALHLSWGTAAPAGPLPAATAEDAQWGKKQPDGQDLRGPCWGE